ncbi:hypothetical protein [Sphingobacterium bovistauri]|uniref:Uncharacterized protein n=1 Tax=Sphingobacterium bovistauri TaxID=2781959 RepID=A0ABS7Z2Y5_9SPHI|nr:hypothetical protein [Sphingobacterium bovistauri]MCA5004553.1 hypothetical protein [Sphingobacterium bovistauri]
MRILLILIFFVQSIFTFAQDTIPSKNNDIKIIQNFINDLAKNEIRSDVILSKYVIVENPTDELYDYLEVSLDEIRINLLSKKIEDIQYIPYAQMPRKDVRDIDLEDLNSNRIYFLNYKNRQLLAVYLEQEKLASFTLVSKGNNKAHFVLY